MTDPNPQPSDEETAPDLGEGHFFPFFARDWLNSESVALLSAEAEGTYVRLLSYAWINDGLLGDADKLRGLTKIARAEWPAVWAELEGFFPLGADGRRRNPKLEAVRATVEEKRLRRVRAGRAGGFARARAKQGDGNAPAMPEQPGSESVALVRHSSSNARATPEQPLGVALADKDKDKDKELATTANAFVAAGRGAPLVAVEGADLPLYARHLAAAANRGVTEKFGEQPSPILGGSATSQRVAEAFRAAGVPDTFAKETLFELARSFAGDRPPRSLGYWETAVLERHKAALAHGDAAAYTGSSPDGVAVVRLDPVARMALEYARDGNEEWRAYCDERGLPWKNETETEDQPV